MAKELFFGKIWHNILMLLLIMVQFNLNIFQSVFSVSVCLCFLGNCNSFCSVKNDVSVLCIMAWQPFGTSCRPNHNVFPWQNTAEHWSTEIYIHYNPAKNGTFWWLSFCSVGIYLYNTAIINKYINYCITIYKFYHFFFSRNIYLGKTTLMGMWDANKID